MKVVFMGTPEFAVKSLQALLDGGHAVAAVFTQPDKPVGRKHILTPPAVKICAQQHGIPVYQPASFKDPKALEILTAIQPDVIVVVAYGKLLPEAVLHLPKFGCVNVHASVLPKYRGASPIQWSIVCGEKQTGVSTMQLDKGMDTGDILLTKTTEITDTDTAQTLGDRLCVMGADLLLQTLDGLKKGQITPQKQDETQASYAPIIKKSDGLIDWTQSADQINCKIRGLQTWPVAYTMAGDKMLKIYSAKVLPDVAGGCGEILSQDKALIVACGEDSALEITELQLEGSKRMPAQDFIRGRKFPFAAF